MTADQWWRGAVIYQVYPRSFADSNNDGIGDLRGIADRMEYIADLGVDAIWISPFFTSPMRDFGYDVSNYRDVDPMFGTLADFDRLVERAHSLNVKVTIDQVLSHTSDQHPWFVASRAGRDNPRADWYVWADPSDDGSPPNNWMSIFGGTAWQWDARRLQYYMHNFLVSQPDLNFHNAEVRAALLADVEFWLQRGVDGFRLDTVNFFVHDAQLRSNPGKPMAERLSREFPASNPYGYQQHIYDKSRPENLDFLRELRALMDRYAGTTTVGEIGDDNALERMAEYTSGGDKLHMAYTFELLGGESSAAFVRRTVEALESQAGNGWPCWAMSNHDVRRSISRWAGDSDPAAVAKVLLAMLASLRGSVCIYQGEELALPEADVPYERLQDPYAFPFWPEFKGRDGCRTPMPWRADAANGGFSSVEPWLPVPEEHLPLAVSVQEADPASVLNSARTFLNWRRAQPALISGELEMVDAPAHVLCLVRRHGNEELLAAFNLQAAPVRFEPAVDGTLVVLEGHGFGGETAGAEVSLPAWSACFARIEP